MNREPEIENLGAFLNEFNKESDRGATLIAASLIDERLKEIIENFLVDGKDSLALLNGPNAVLGTLSARVLTAYSLGLIQDNEYEEINIIRKIRNEYGHKWKDVSFEKDNIRKLCLKLPWLGPEELEKGATARSRFNFAVTILLTDLLWRASLVRRERRKLKIWPNKSRAV